MSTISHYIAEYGVFAIAIGAGFEGESAAIAGGVMAHRGLVPVWGAFLAIAIGAFTADEIFFFIGRRFRDRPFVARMRHKPAFARAMGFIERYPDGYILVFRFLYGLRTVSPMALGLTQVPYRRFVALNALAAVIWAAIMTTVGVLFGPAVDHVLDALAPYKTPLLIALPIPGTCIVLWLLWKRRQRRLAAEKASVEAET